MKGEASEIANRREFASRHLPEKRLLYFYVEYGVNHGHFQMIESNSFPKDFGADTIARMMDLLPQCMKKKRSGCE